MGVRVLNLAGPNVEARTRDLVPGVEIASFPAAEVPDDVRAEVLFSSASPAPVHERLDDIGIRWMHLPMTGVDRWPTRLLRGRTVTCARGVSAIPIAEYVLAMMLAFEKDVPGIYVHEPPAQWNFVELGGLFGRTVAIVGLGGIGEAVATRALAFGSTVRAFRRRPELGSPDGVELAVDLDDLLASADHLVIAAPATDATQHLLDARAFTVVKPGVHIVNIARGSLIDQEALRAALDDGRVGRATLDAVTPEPLPEGHWLYAHPRARITPHVSWSTPGQLDRIDQAYADNLARYVAGEQLVGIVDPDAGY